MGLTSKGLKHGGKTKHYLFQYDSALSSADGVDRTNALIDACEKDYSLMESWFVRELSGYPFPMNVSVKAKSGGASWIGSEVVVSITLKPGSGTSVNFLRYLLVSEVTEMFMAAQGKGWSDTFDEGSKGEGLSRFLGVQFQVANGLGAIPPSGFAVSRLWLNSDRGNFVDKAPDDRDPDAVTGCATLFIYFLHSQLGFSIEDIIAAAGDTLARVYQNLTGKSDGFSAFSSIVDSHFPKSLTSNPPSDDLFPVPELAAFWPPNQITSGYSDTAQLVLTCPAKAEIVVTLSSDDPSLVSVASPLTIGPGDMSAAVPLQAGALASTLAQGTVNIHATYAGKTLSIGVTVSVPRVTSLTLSPSEVVCGATATGTVTMNWPSLSGSVAVDLISDSPGFATVVPTHLPIPQNQSTATFQVQTPDIKVPFKKAHVTIQASSMGSYADAVLTVDPKVVAGILQSVVLIPSTVTGGGTTHGIVTLENAVGTDTVVGLAALDGSGHLPLQSDESTVASVHPSVTVSAGATSATFAVTTKPITPHTQRTVTIVAGAVVQRSTVLTITS
jgi:hypothetical protein